MALQNASNNLNHVGDTENPYNQPDRQSLIQPSLFSMSYNYLISSDADHIGPDETNPQRPACIAYEFVIYSLIGGTICLIGVVGNCLCIGVFWHDRRKSSTLFLVLALAVVDTTVLLTWTTVPAVVSLARFTGTLAALRPFLPYAQVYIYPVCTLTHLLTSWVTVLVALHRYVAVCQPHDIERYGSLRLARIQFAALLVCATIFNVPRFLETRIGYHLANNGSTVRAIAVRRPMARSDLYENVYLVGIYQLVIYVIPLVLLVIFTQRLLRALKVAKARREVMMTVNNQRLHADFTFSLIVVVIIFLICQLFNPIRRVLVAVSTSFISPSSSSSDPDDDCLDADVHRSAHELCGSFYFYYAPIVVLAVSINSSVNFFVYAACGRRFRAKVMRLVRCGRARPMNSVQPIAVVPVAVMSTPLPR